MVLDLAATIADAEEVHEGLALVRLRQVGHSPQFLLLEPLPLIFLDEIELDLLVLEIVEISPFLLQEAQLFLSLLGPLQLFYLHVMHVDLVRYLLQWSLRVHEFLQGGGGHGRTTEGSRRGLSLVGAQAARCPSKDLTWHLDGYA